MEINNIETLVNNLRDSGYQVTVMEDLQKISVKFAVFTSDLPIDLTDITDPILAFRKIEAEVSQRRNYITASINESIEKAKKYEEEKANGLQEGHADTNCVGEDEACVVPTI